VRHGLDTSLKINHQNNIIMKLILTLSFVLMCFFLQAQTRQDTVRMAIAKSIVDMKITPEPVTEIKNDFVLSGTDSIAIRIYRPVLNEKLPIVYLVHGAGWVAGDLDTHDNICRYFANHLNSIVVAVNYRRAPEHKFPVPFDDSYLVFKWIHANKKRLKGNGKLILVGESAGGQLAASICMVNSQEKKPIPVLAQVLVYPALNLSKGSVSYSTYPYFIDWYLNPTDNTDDVRISPFLAKDFVKTPPAIIVVGEKDKIKNDGEEFHNKLLQAGIGSSLFVQPNTGHVATHWCAAGGKAIPAMEYVVSKIKELYLK
jgi:acetyl esterase